MRTEVVIDRPIDEVATYAADPSNAPEWYVNIDRVDWQTAPPAAVGFAYDLRRPVPRPPARALPAWRRLG
ncbi:MAG: SRPBCC family protein [Acidimicrobiales bacterium]